jgi:hypothetical protein
VASGNQASSNSLTLELDLDDSFSQRMPSMHEVILSD